MKLVEALQEIKNHVNKVAIKELAVIGYRYDNEKCRMYDIRDQHYLPDSRIVSFCEEELFSNGWKIVDAVKPKYKIGDRFVLDLSHSVKVTVECMIFNSIYNVVGTVSGIKYDGEYIYILSNKDYLEDYRDICDENGVITQEISEKELSTYDMVISQNN